MGIRRLHASMNAGAERTVGETRFMSAVEATVAVKSEKVAHRAILWFVIHILQSMHLEGLGYYNRSVLGMLNKRQDGDTPFMTPKCN
jgi:hypothetical protein